MPSREEDEVIEDSEPERQERRRGAKEYKERGTRSKAVMSIDERAEICSTPTENIIDILDDEVMSTSSRSPRTPSPLSSQIKSQPGKPLEILNSEQREIIRRASKRSLRRQSPSAFLDLVKNVAPRSAPETSESEELDAVSKFEHFAFKNIQINKVSSAGPSRAVSLASAESGTAPKKEVRKAHHRSAFDFSGSDLNKVMKCVSCDIRWTTRKSAAQKITHMQSCAKKNMITDDTIRVLIRREIDSAPVERITGKGKGKEKSVEETGKSLLEDVVNDAGPRRKRKRARAPETVKSVVETRDLILERARTVIGHSVISDSSIVGDTEARRDVPPLTQAFGESALRGAVPSSRHPTRAVGENGALSTDQINVPDRQDDDQSPATQDFAPSRYRYSRKSSSMERPNSPPFISHVGIDGIPTSSSHLIGYVPPPFSSLSESAWSTPTEREDAKMESSKKPARNRETMQRPLDVMQIKPCDEFNFNNDFDDPLCGDPCGYSDDAYLHFYPSIDKHELVEHSSMNKDTLYTPLTLKEAVPKKQIRKKSKKDENVQIMGRHMKKIPHSELDSPDTDLELEIGRLMIEDKQLHMRILRYEPIHFDSLMALLTTRAEPTRGLKLRLRSFLDKQGINFYGADAVGGRTRR